MMIHSHLKDYTVHQMQTLDFVKELMDRDDAFFVIDKKLYEIYYEKMFFELPQESLLLIEATEKNKCIDTALEICLRMTGISAKRNACLISFGGGITQDITGFAANILYRGIHWIFVPTTLLAACDSCIGGKTSLNFHQYKNLLGTFFPPDDIYICPAFFQTLDMRDFYSGLGEVFKFALMGGEDDMHLLSEKYQSLIDRDIETLDQFIEKCLLFKKPFIEADEFDRGVRIHLNFAHTFGHALETLSNFQIPHGTAVAMGMVIANYISESRGMLSHHAKDEMEQLLRSIIFIPSNALCFDRQEMIMAVKKDKKQTDDHITAVLMDNEHHLHIVHDIKPAEIEKGIHNLKMLLQEDK